MTTEVLIKGFFAAVFSGIFAWTVFDRDSEDDGDTRRQRYLPYISGALLPLFVFAVLGAAVVFSDKQNALAITLTLCFGVFLHICLYYLLLMPALPVLRRHISARACAVLWMLPNYLYLTQMSCMRLPEPLLVIEAPLGMIRILLVLWAVGFVSVMVWKTVSHLAFRARILRRASPVVDPAVSAVWRREVEAARFRRPRFRLVCSPDVRTPLSVGLLGRKVRVVLPDRVYTPEQLALIFRHELIHIGREDALNKLFLVFCCAMCWFNPLMWLAAKRSSEDLELSCDETVLLDADGDEKRRYADLLLTTAGDERGFTTCLSASAEALRYRLKNAMSPKKKPSGALAVGLVFFVLCMSSGHIALACGERTGAEVIYGSRPAGLCALSDIASGDFVCTDEAALHRYLSAMPMAPVSGNFSFEQEGHSLSLILDTPEGLLSLTLSDRYAKVVPLYGDRLTAQFYYLPGGVDWDALRAFIVERPALTVRVTGTEDSSERDFPASLSYVGLVDERSGDVSEVLYETDPRETPGGIFGYAADRASLSFNLPLEGACTVTIAPSGGGNSRTVRLRAQSLSFSLPDEPSRYTVSGEFLGTDGRRYRMEFQFEVGDP